MSATPLDQPGAVPRVKAERSGVGVIDRSARRRGLFTLARIDQLPVAATQATVLRFVTQRLQNGRNSMREEYERIVGLVIDGITREGSNYFC